MQTNKDCTRHYCRRSRYLRIVRKQRRLKHVPCGESDIMCGLTEHDCKTLKTATSHIVRAPDQTPRQPYAVAYPSSITGWQTAGQIAEDAYRSTPMYRPESSSSPRSTAWNPFQSRLRSAQFGQPLRAFSRNQRIKPRVDEGGFLLEAGHCRGLLDQGSIEIQRGFHINQYA